MKERRDVRRTKNAIEHAYLELLFRKGCARITVNEVIELANVSRGTFYAHYRDIPDLEEKVEDKVVNALKEALWVDDVERIEDITESRLKNVFDLFYSFRDDFKELLKAQNSTKMLYKAQTALADAFENSNGKNMIAEKLGEPKAVMLCRSMAASFVEAFVYYINHEAKFDREGAESLISGYIGGGIERALNS